MTERDKFEEYLNTNTAYYTPDKDDEGEYYVQGVDMMWRIWQHLTAVAEPSDDARDAARYRWLRAAWLEDPDPGEDVAWSPIMHSASESEMDADIDAAIRLALRKGDKP